MQKPTYFSLKEENMLQIKIGFTFRLCLLHHIRRDEGEVSPKELFVATKRNVLGEPPHLPAKQGQIPLDSFLRINRPNYYRKGCF